MNIQQSRDNITRTTQWVIDESTFFVLDEEQCVWIASVTTSHNRKQGEEEVTFSILVQFTNYFVIQPDWDADLGCWFSALISGNNLSGSHGHYHYAHSIL